MEKTMTRKEIINSIVKNVQLSHPKAIAFLEATFEIMISSLANQGALKIASFCSFKVRHKTKRMGRSPKTGEDFVITPGLFRLSLQLV